ncbi:PH domain-containing protein, partial [Lacticaseibacillus camelliae]
QAQLAGETPAAGFEAESPTARYTISTHDLNLYALTSLGFIPILTGALWLWDKFDDIVPKDWEHNLDRYMAQLAAAALLALIVFALIIGILISYLRLLQKYYQFTLTQNGDTLTAARGLLKRTQVSTRLRQLQAVRFSQTVVRQWFHLTTVQGLIASNASDDETSNAMVLMPVVKEDQALATMRRFITWLPAAVPALQPVLRKRYWYYIRNAVLTGVGLAVGISLAIYFWRARWLPIALGLSLAWLVFTALQGAYAARSAGVKIISPDLLVLQKGGWWRRQRFFVRRENIQSLEVNTSYWLAKKQVAHVVINVREGDDNENIEVSYLEQSVADAVRAWYRPEDFQGGDLI